METQMIRNKNGQVNIILQERKSAVSTKRNLEKGFKNNPFKHIDQAFSSFVGMNELKERIKEIYATVVINEKRRELGLQDTKQVLHMLFKGNPGTGKTTVARKLAKLYFEMNLLTKGHCIEAERADLVGEYIGQTAQKTRSIIQKAQGGVLFIDEAYSLARGGEKDFGKEAIDTLVKHMEDNQHDFVLILAGYPYEMERFLTLNPGLQSRFPFILDFKNYEAGQLLSIAKRMAVERDYQLTREAELELKAHLYMKTKEYNRNFANARYVRNVIENSIRMHAMRLLANEHFTADDLIHLTAKDLQINAM
ncbi:MULTISPECIES: AAA family ATPase [Virgibacillus]|uniref:AAA family ATPase n=1 Tax=Virgibacillus salarius TaxID=447199 RepID=A0A941DYZ9_9BACI|nr:MULTISPECIES: AAA family ATPase [Bacillaceae]MBR7797951.1 AAA family ATPase [Virgibacillus salarius]NAZ10660.1 AAA family ATPase [Agaribacter marinus]